MSGADVKSQLLRLPPALVGHAHLAKLIRELEDVENDFETQKARALKDTKKNTDSKKDTDNKKPPILHTPTMSRALSDCVELNDVDIADSKQRMDFKKNLNLTKDKAPAMHFTFATEPDGESVQRLVDWVRQEINPQALVSIGVQPALVGGVYIRTPNKVHDFSLRRLLHDKRGVIVKEIEALQ